MKEIQAGHRRHAHGAHRQRQLRYQQMHPQLGPQRLPRGDGQRLGDPQALALQRHGRGADIVAAGQQAQAQRRQHRYEALASDEQSVHHQEHLTALDEGRCRQNQQKHRAQAAVQHIKGTGGKPAQLLAQQGGVDAGLPDGLLVIDRLGGIAGGGGDVQKAAGDKIPHQRQQGDHHGGDHQHGHAVAAAHPAEEVQRIDAALDLIAEIFGVQQQAADQSLRPETGKVVQPEEHQRHHHGDKALVLQLQADLCHYPAQCAGQRQHEQGNDDQQHHAAQNTARRDRDGAPIDNDGRQDHDGGIHQAHEIDA